MLGVALLKAVVVTGVTSSFALAYYNPRKERAYKKSGHICPSYPWSNERERKNATGLYYLVREVGPTLISRRTASSGMNNGDDDNDDSDDGDDSGDKMMMQERSHRNVKL